ncbi:MAG: DUF5320 domain-containing protein [Planctomycetota bacterium]
MPRGDRTGPLGRGPMTGRAAGYCAGFPVPGYANPAVWGGFGRGGGRGHRWRHWFYATGLPGWMRGPAAGAAVPYAGYGAPGPWAAHPYPGAAPFAPLSAEEELEILKKQAESLTSALDEIRKRIGDLESRSSAKED